MKFNKGFTLLEIIVSLIILGVIAVAIVPKNTDQGVEDVVDASVLKDALRQTIMRAMSDISTANWNVVVSSKTILVKKDTTTISTYALQKYSGSFSISFNQLGQPYEFNQSGQPQTGPVLPYSIAIDPETGFIP